MSHSLPRAGNRPALSLFDPHAMATSRRRFLGTAAVAMGAAVLGPLGEDSPDEEAELSPDMKLGAFFGEWFLPVVLLNQQHARPGTILLYRNAIDWWQALTDDPPVSQITDRMLAKFADKLRKARYRRGVAGDYRPLSPASVAKHLKVLRAIIMRLGPTLDPKRPGKGLLREVPLVPTEVVNFMTKPSFTLEQARAIAAASLAFALPSGVSPAWKSAYVALHFYTGLREGTVLSIEDSHLVEEDGQTVLKLPANVVTKVPKPIEMVLHPQAVAAIAPLRGKAGPLLAPFCHRRHLVTLHERLQAAAGLPPEARQSPHAWRRTHGTQIAELGLGPSMEMAQRALAHGDRRTTETFYVNLLNQLRLKLPELWPAQKRLFD